MLSTRGSTCRTFNLCNFGLLRQGLYTSNSLSFTTAECELSWNIFPSNDNTYTAYVNKITLNNACKVGKVFKLNFLCLPNITYFD